MNAGLERSILMAAFHFPPVQTSSGVHRTLSFARALVNAGWDTTVLTVSRNALPSMRAENEAMIPGGIRVVRALAFDSVRTLSWHGKYFGRTAVPDPWVSWVLTGTARGLLEVRRKRPRILFSTYPIASAHMIGYLLWKFTGIPWIADFRDPMAQAGYPADPARYRSYLRIEEYAVRNATRLLFTTPGAVRFYRERYPHELEGRVCLIENGFDEAMFDGLLGENEKERAPADGPLRLLHSGVVYPEERDPRPLFRALSALKSKRQLNSSDICVVFRASGHESVFLPMVKGLGIEDMVEFLPAIGYNEAVKEMAEADALLVMQAENCNYQIPAKTYEYLRIGRPIIGLCHPAGDTAALLRLAGVERLAPLDDVEAIENLLTRIVAEQRNNRLNFSSSADIVARYSRDSRAREFLEVVDAALLESD